MPYTCTSRIIASSGIVSNSSACAATNEWSGSDNRKKPAILPCGVTHCKKHSCVTGVSYATSSSRDSSSKSAPAVLISR